MRNGGSVAHDSRLGRALVTRAFEGFLALAVASIMMVTNTPYSYAVTPPDAIVIGMEAEPPNLDPAQYSGLHSARAIRRMFEGLTRQKEESTEVEPSLAKSWEISSDGRVYTFKLREGVRFHDGTPLDAAAVKYSLDRPMDSNYPAYKWGKWSFVTGNLNVVKQVDVVDPLTLRITLKNPYAPFLVSLADVSTYIVSPKAVEASKEDFANHPVGAGPYRFGSWNRGSQIVLERWDGYWGPRPRSARLVYRWMVEDQARVTELLTGNVDLILPVPPEMLPQLQKDPNTALYRQRGVHFWYLGLNTEKKPLSDKRVRQAIAYAIDKQAITRDTLRGTAAVADGMIMPGSWGYDSGIRKYRRDLAKAKALLTEAGYARGFEINFWAPESGSGMQIPKEMATLIQAQLAEAGIRAKLQFMEWASYLARLRGNDHEMFANSWLAGTEDPDKTYYFLIHSSSVPFPNRAHYKNPRVDALLDEARATVDQKKRGGLYRQVQEILADELPYIAVDHDIQIIATRKNLAGFRLHPSYDVRLEGVSKGK